MHQDRNIQPQTDMLPDHQGTGPPAHQLHHPQGRPPLIQDLKPGNIFISRDGVAKIGDFGMSKEFGTPNRRLTASVCTMEYRAPELFLETNYYTEKADIWSLGCIFYYVMTGSTLFTSDSNSELSMIIKIFALTGTPDEESWPGYKQLPKYY